VLDRPFARLRPAVTVAFYHGHLPHVPAERAPQLDQVGRYEPCDLRRAPPPGAM
jgi:hypothetical protein